MSLRNEILARLAEGKQITAKEMLHLGNRAAIDQVLSRRARSGKLIRVSRGLYVAPVQGRFGSRPPSASKVLESLAEQRGETVVRHGASAANALGLTTQIPVREVYLTSVATGSAWNCRRRHGPGISLAGPGEGVGGSTEGASPAK